jgi:Icc-related predicted phosphoesterase
MSLCFFVSDLHGHRDRYEKLFARIASEPPQLVFLGGDLLPPRTPGFISGYLRRRCLKLRERLEAAYPRVLVILGNDDPRAQEGELLAGEREGLWINLHNRSLEYGGHRLFGYACIPPSPFLLKDWERYDVSHHVDVGCVAPEEGWRSMPAAAAVGTIQEELGELAGADDLEKAAFLFHAPPYGSALDRTALDGREVDHVPLDPHVGSIAVRRFIEERGPLLALHGHVHESSRLSGEWRQKIGRTQCFSAAWDGVELALVRFSLENPQAAERLLI